MKNSVDVLAAQFALQCLSDLKLPTMVNSFLMDMSFKHAVTEVSSLVSDHHAVVKKYEEFRAECVKHLHSPGALHRITSSSPNITSSFVFWEKVVLWRWCPEPKEDGGFFFVL